MAQSSENPYHSLQLIQAADGDSVLAGRGELCDISFDMQAIEISGEESLLLFFFDPRDEQTRKAGVLALLALLDPTLEGKQIVFVTPDSKKSKEMTAEVVEICRQKTGIDHQLHVFEKFEDDPRLRDDDWEGHVQDYIPVTSPDAPRFLAMTAEQEVEIKQAVDVGAVIVILDDIVSTGATLEAIETLLRHIGVGVEQRLAVGAEYPAELVEIRDRKVVWKQKQGLPKPKLEVQTAFVLPLFEGEDVVTIMERYK